MSDPTGGGVAITTLLENTSDAIVVLDAQWRYTCVNHAAEMLFRRKRSELLGTVHWEQYPMLLGTPAEEQLRGARDSQRPVNFEQFIPGLYAWHSVRAVPADGSLVLFCRDITDRVRALREDAVREGLRNILEHVPVAITVSRGPEHRIELQNKYSRALVGGRNVEGRTVRNALQASEAPGVVKLLDRVMTTRQRFSGRDLPLSFDRDDQGGTTHGRFDLTFQPIFDTDGQVSGILHMALDVTERHRERELLARYAAEREATLRQMSEGVILTDESGRITFVNDRARDLHGIAVLDVEVDAYSATYQLLTVDGEPYPPSELPLARAVLYNEYVSNARWRIRRPDGSEVLVEGNAQPVFDERNQKIACALIMRCVQDE
ncbi:MAG: PAS domain-containing protein [Pseudomonadota bacterium]